jgi:hypothetical protein
MAPNSSPRHGDEHGRLVPQSCSARNRSSQPEDVAALETLLRNAASGLELDLPARDDDR